MAVVDRPGVLAEIAGLFSEHEVSVETVEQTIEHGDVQVGGAGHEHPAPTATLVIGTHEAAESSLAATVAALSASSVVKSVVSVLRVEGL